MARSTREVWAQRVRGWKASGLTGREYALKIGVSPGSLSYWSSHLRSEEKREQQSQAKAAGVRRQGVSSKKKAASASFVEVVAPLVMNNAGVEVVTSNGHVLRLSVGFDAETLRRALDATR